MTKRIGELDIEKAAKQAAGNWKKFDCFVWFVKDEIDQPEDWAIIYTHHRDSTLLDESNAAIIEEALKPFTEDDDPDVVMESHIHWAVGHINGFSVRVYRDGNITDAFRKYHELAERMDTYLILDDEDYSNREYEATIKNIIYVAWRLKNDYELPDNWQYDVYGWISEHDPNELESRDDQGGYPSEETVKAAFDGLGYETSGVGV